MSGLQVLGRESEVRQIRRALRSSLVGALVVGDRGVGKSTVLQVLKETIGQRLVHVVAHPESKGRPLGAFASTFTSLPSAAVADVQLISYAIAEFRSSGAALPVVILVDDVHDLDHASEHMLDQLARSGDALIVATLDTSVAVPSWLAALLQQQLIARVELGPLAPSDLQEAISSRVDGVVTQDLHAEIWRLSHGNPLVAFALAPDRVNGGPIELRPTDALISLVDERIVELSVAERQAIELVAVAERVEFDLLENLFEPATLNALEARNVLAVDRSANRVTARVSDPVVALGVTGVMTMTRTRQVERILAGWVAQRGARRHEDALRVSSWDLDSGDNGRPEIQILGARRALESADLDLCERLAKSALSMVESFEAHLTLGRCLLEQRHHDLAAVSFAKARHLAHTDEQLALVVVALCDALVVGRADTETALELVSNTLANITEARARRILELRCARLRLGAGDPVAAMGLDLHNQPGQHASAAVESAELKAAAQLVVGEVEGALATTAVGLTLLEALPHPARFQREKLNTVALHAHLNCLQLKPAQALVSKEFDAACRRGDWYGAAIWQTEQAGIHGQRGDFARAEKLFAAAAKTVVDHDPFALARLIDGRRALALIQAGNRDGASDALASVRAESVASSYQVGVLVDRVHYWMLGQQGQTERASQRSAEIGANAASRTQNLVAAAVLHDAVRMGHASVSAGMLAALVDVVSVPVVSLYWRHAIAQIEGDADELFLVAKCFANAGAWLLAAEAAVQASKLNQGKRRRTARHRAQALADTALALCTQANTPALRDRESVLTTRQVQIAQLAGMLSNNEVADQLSISVRTVENHLNTVYHLLDIHTREELREVVASEEAAP